MEDDRSFLHTLILGSCILICALLIARMAFHQPVPYFNPHTVTEPSVPSDQTEVDVRLELSEHELTEQLTRRLPADFPLQNWTIALSETNCMTVTAQLSRSQFSEWIAQEQLSVPRVLLLLLPETSELQADVAFSGTTVSIMRARAAGMSLPTFVTEPIATYMTRVFQDFLSEQGFSDGKIEIVDGKCRIFAK